MLSFLQSYFDFTKKERRGIISLLVIILIIAFIPSIYSRFSKKDNQITYDESMLQLSIAEKDSSKSYYENDDQGYTSNYKKFNTDKENLSATLFYFDPNTISENEWKMLGVKEHTIQGIQKYISKGGKFRQPSDVEKIWGISDALKERIIPYVRIVATEKNYNRENIPYQKKVYEKKTIAAININNADSAAFEGLPGIGGGYARRIINFRNKLGGFYKIEQVAETFGLPDSTFQKVKQYFLLGNKSVKKININTATLEDLKAHPYIRWQLASIILNYKKQHGDFKSIEDLKKIMTIDVNTYNKIYPYLEL